MVVYFLASADRQPARYEAVKADDLRSGSRLGMVLLQYNINTRQLPLQASMLELQCQTENVSVDE